ncbi:MAG TPA: aminotransferase class I/II-fold pyridoxal phosphate-dependent enzyme [Candidatus Baltobacteraceae bacterium]|jgi:histidinol-phosphate aminotransferase|nr:aminotransferase class I/II-fold pyridoxal phosphate-dependent enzyme [Candidatus Baltobacteraceae bacterium]
MRASRPLLLPDAGSSFPRPVPLVESLPVTVPFIAPEELTRTLDLPDLVRLGANESTFGPAPAALEAMRRELERSWAYPDPHAYDLCRALAAHHGCAVDEILVTAGIDDLHGILVRAYLGAGETVVATVGTYPTFAYHVAGYGSRIEGVPYTDDGRVQLDLLIETAQRTNARMIFLANPDNPSGSFASAGAVRALVNALPPGVMLALDEAYSDFAADEDLLTPLIHPQVLRMRTFSKAHGLAGARIGYALAPRELLEPFNKIRLHFGVNRNAQIGALASLGEREYVAGVVREIERGREEYARLAEGLGLSMLPSRTNFVLFDIGTRARAEALVRALLLRGVFIRKPGMPPLDRYVRVSVGNTDERRRFGDALAEALPELDAKAEKV